MNNFTTDKAVTIRYPSTANLLIDSADRIPAVFSSPWQFQISKPQNVQNGFMTRVATTEVTLEWYEPNIAAPKNFVTVDICGTGIVGGQTITLPEGFYTVEETLDYLVKELNDLSGTSGVGFSIEFVRTSLSEVQLEAVGGEVKFEATPLAILLGINTPGLVPSLPIVFGTDLRNQRYIDFVSAQLTYNQDLKDNSTAAINRDVLCRWYMAYDNSQVSDTDGYGFPLLMGYTPFVLRRLFNPPKQIKWDSSQPVGNLAFEVYGEDGNLVQNLSQGDSQWLMTLQLSEN